MGGGAAEGEEGDGGGVRCGEDGAEGLGEGGAGGVDVVEDGYMAAVELTGIADAEDSPYVGLTLVARHHGLGGMGPHGVKVASYFNTRYIADTKGYPLCLVISPPQQLGPMHGYGHNDIGLLAFGEFFERELASQLPGQMGAVVVLNVMYEPVEIAFGIIHEPRTDCHHIAGCAYVWQPQVAAHPRQAGKASEAQGPFAERQSIATYWATVRPQRMEHCAQRLIGTHTPKRSAGYGHRCCSVLAMWLCRRLWHCLLFGYLLNYGELCM